MTIPGRHTTDALPLMSHVSQS